jgi:hypothetical protein
MSSRTLESLVGASAASVSCMTFYSWKFTAERYHASGKRSNIALASGHDAPAAYVPLLFL